jgi:hypothetical protein
MMTEIFLGFGWDEKPVPSGVNQNDQLVILSQVRVVVRNGEVVREETGRVQKTPKGTKQK